MCRCIADWNPEALPNAARKPLNCTGVSAAMGAHESLSACRPRRLRSSASIAVCSLSARKASRAARHSCTISVNHSSMTCVVTRKPISSAASVSGSCRVFSSVARTYSS